MSEFVGLQEEREAYKNGYARGYEDGRKQRKEEEGKCIWEVVFTPNGMAYLAPCVNKYVMNKYGAYCMYCGRKSELQKGKTYERDTSI